MASASSEIDSIAARNIASFTRAVRAIDSQGPSQGPTVWTQPDQLRFFRLYIERGIEEFETAEDSHFNFLKECLFLAINNVQDARLHFLEKDLADSAGPASSEELIYEFVILLVVEVVIACSLEVAAPAVLSTILGSAVAKEVRRLFVSETEADAAEAMKQLVEWETEQASKLEQFRRLQASLTTATEAQKSGVQAQLDELLAEYTEYSTLLSVYKAAVGKDLKLAERARALLTVASDSTAVSEPTLKQLLDGVVEASAGAARLRIGLTSGDAVLNTIDALQERANGAQELGAAEIGFTTSTHVSRLLATIADQQSRAQENWIAWREYVGFLTDDELLKSANIHALVANINVYSSQVQGLRRADAARDGYVKGFEAALWYQWLRYNNVLCDPVHIEFPSGPLPTPGDVVGGTLIVQDSNGAFPNFSGQYYAGIARLSDEQAIYLYFTFAKAFFVKTPKAAPAPLVFDQARYDEVPSLPERTFANFANNTERTKRLEQMKLLVIVYFLSLFKMPATGKDASFRNAARDLLGVGQGVDLWQQWLKTLPINQGAAPADGTSLPGLTAPITQTSEPSTSDERWLALDARSQLENAITDLDLKVSLYPLQFGPQRGRPPLGAPTSDDALAVITGLQQTLTARVAAFQSLAANQKDLRSEIDQHYADRIAALTNWRADANRDLAWQWYGTDKTLAGGPVTA